MRCSWTMTNWECASHWTVDRMECGLRIKCCWSDCYGICHGYLGDELSSNSSKNVWSLLLQSPFLHSLHHLLSNPCGSRICMLDPSWNLSLCYRSILTILTVATSSKPSFSSTSSLWCCWTKLLEKPRFSFSKSWSLKPFLFSLFCQIFDLSLPFSDQN